MHKISVIRASEQLELRRLQLKLAEIESRGDVHLKIKEESLLYINDIIRVSRHTENRIEFV